MTTTAKVAVGFDATDQKLTVINSDKVSEETTQGDVVDVDGRMLTILKFCDSVESARASCEEHVNDLNGMGLAASVNYEDDVRSGTSDTPEDDSLLDLDNLDNGMDNFIDNEIDMDDSTMIMPDMGSVLGMQKQLEELRGVMRDVIAMSMADLQTDVERINQRQHLLIKFYKKTLGSEIDGRVRNPFSDKYKSKALDTINSASSFFRLPEKMEPNIVSQFDELEKMWTKRHAEVDHFVREERQPPKYSHTIATGGRSYNNFAKPAPRPTTSRRDDSLLDTTDQEYSFGTNGTQGKRIVNGIVKPVDKLYYPFISKEEEEDCLEQANGQPPIYAQLLAKILFADSIMMYFKDQDTAKRNWLHDAVDYRFPTLDKPTHVSKWKNCSFFINKNMREAVMASGNPMPRAPCGPRGPIGPKDKSRIENKDETMYDSSSEEPEDQMEKSVLKEVQQKSDNKVKTYGRGDEALSHIEFKYLPSSYEKECFADCRGDQYKYAELMALKLFSTSLPLKFKEQDQVRKEWLRSCVEARFPIHDRERNDQRWKICGQTCNRNRTKIVGADGREEKYPFFDQSVEEECFKKCDGLPSVYAELMNSKLFPDSLHMFFKDQDIGKRNWLHSILDKRFPSNDKVAQTSKWKACTNAINKKLFDGTVTPITREVMQQSIQEEEEPALQSRASSGRFERRQNSETPSGQMNGGLKRKHTEESIEIPSAKRESMRNRLKKEKALAEFSAYPFITESEESSIFEASKGNPQVYGREIGRVLFKDTIKNYFKDQDPDRRQWIREILDFRYPARNPIEQKQRWKNVMAAINRNMTSVSTVTPRRSVPN